MNGSQPIRWWYWMVSKLSRKFVLVILWGVSSMSGELEQDELFVDPLLDCQTMFNNWLVLMSTLVWGKLYRLHSAWGRRPWFTTSHLFCIQTFISPSLTSCIGQVPWLTSSMTALNTDVRLTPSYEFHRWGIIIHNGLSALPSMGSGTPDTWLESCSFSTPSSNKSHNDSYSS